MILAIVAHPDDESLFAGAALAQHVLHGSRVVVAALSNGVGARLVQQDEILAAEAVRRDQFKKACGILGAQAVPLYVFPDQQSDAVPQLTINRYVEDLIEDFPPQLVYTHHVGDLNLDHRRVAEAVLVATRMGPPVRCMSPEFPDRCVGRKFKPNVKQMCQPSAWEARIKACLCYEAELRPYPHPRSERAIRERGESFMEIR